MFDHPDGWSEKRQAFTLIELLVVIAIIAIITVVVILTLNPAELLRQSRDSNRLADLATLTSAINIYSTDQVGASGYSLGSSTVTYVSVYDPTATTTAGTDCTGLGFSSGGSFHCPASSTARNVNGTGWIPVNFKNISTGSPISALPVDPTNSTSTNLYYTYQTDGTTFKLRAVPESQKYLAQAGVNPTMFTAGSNLALGGGSAWIPVPGNSQFSTNNFWVMKYTAVCSNGEGIYLNDFNTGSGTYNDVAENCTAANGRAPASLSGGWQIANVSQTSSIAYCAAIGAHLITNNEWQTIAWNAEGQASNWSGGTVGSGYVYSGHNDNVPANASPAGSSDSAGCVGTDGPASCGGTGSNATQLRTLTLSDGAVIWDLGGNVWDWTSNTIVGTNDPYGTSTAFNWSEYTAIVGYGTTTQQTIGPSNSTWNSSQGMGMIYTEHTVDPTTYGLIRGGGWSFGNTAGLEALSLNATSGYQQVYDGFRCTR
jgi:prepilin-type N-terminal cleavage/methylation domain-containing protein